MNDKMIQLNDNSKIKTFIIDDEKEDCDRLESLLINKFENVVVENKINDADYGIKKIIENLPDIVFLDVELPHKSGFDVVKEVRRQNVNPTFIFVTRYDQYAIKAIHNAVFDYLLKPVDIDELKEAIERFCCLREEKRQINLPKNLKNKYSLTQREIEIIELIAQYKSSKEIANILFISRHTVDTHRRHILRKTEMKTTAEFLSHLYNF